NSAAMKNLMACRTLNEAADAQNKLVQANVDEAMSAATKISEMAIKVCTEACEPLNEQMTKSMSKMSA
ncbi:MAG TPA: phasin family protein, partial [Alphaproteobacteria bacterium]|nr:phasin family protein [Alphaproteobacteria bacterium]